MLRASVRKHTKLHFLFREMDRQAGWTRSAHVESAETNAAGTDLIARYGGEESVILRK
jgi:hypothetical protein